MSRISLNELKNFTTLSTEQRKSIQGGLGICSPWGYIPYRALVSNPYAFGFGGFRNQFNQGQAGFGIQAGTFAMQASFAQHNSNWMSNFRSGW